jgi:hypothetical protein
MKNFRFRFCKKIMVIYLLKIIITLLRFFKIIIGNWNKNRYQEVNRIDMKLISITCVQSTWKRDGKNSEIKRASARAVWGWVTDRKVWPRVSNSTREVSWLTQTHYLDECIRESAVMNMVYMSLRGHPRMVYAENSNMLFF